LKVTASQSQSRLDPAVYYGARLPVIAKEALLRYVLMALISLFAIPSTAMAVDPCSLMSSADASALLSQSAGAGKAAGPTRDEDSSGQISYCTYRAGNAGLILSVVEYSSPVEAMKALTLNLVKGRMEEDDAKVSEEPGVGEKTFYAVSGEGSMYVFLKGNKVVGLAVGGPGSPKPAAVKAALRARVMAVAARL
jgi:hypothetical protein